MTFTTAAGKIFSRRCDDSWPAANRQDYIGKKMFIRAFQCNSLSITKSRNPHSRIIRQIKVSITLNLIRDIGSQGCFLDTEMNSAWHSAAGSGLQPEPKIKLERVKNIV
jgi:hypothetical protein